jgi:REP element-mobilizing transposase RayT
MAKKKRAPRQLELHIPQRGGKRRNAGRPRLSPRPQVAHVKRARIQGSNPVQITLRVCEGVPSLREAQAWRAIVKAFRAARERTDFRIVHYSVMANHLHLIVEADGPEAFSAGMRSLTTRLAMRINRAVGHHGRVFEHRYHSRELSSPREVLLSLQYVLLNFRKHAAQLRQRLASGWLDPRSSAARFDGWRTAIESPHTNADYGTCEPQTWLMRSGWRKAGRLDVDAIPGRPN